MDPQRMQELIDQASWVASDTDLAALCSRAREAGSVALDTEFERVDTYYPKLALVQLAIGDAIALVDPLAIGDPAPLRDLLEDPDTEVVIHSCTEDVDVLGAWCGARPRSLFDTQLAAAFCGGRFGIGYRDLVAQEFDLELDKGATRSDWLVRPLSADQHRYAAMDVALLLPLMTRQHAHLDRLGRLPWLREECDRLVAETLDRPGPAEVWRNVKRAGGLSRRGLAALQLLAAWREEQARERDRPRGWLVKDEHLVLLAQVLPAEIGQLREQGLPAHVYRRWGSELQDILDRVRDLSDAELPEQPPGPLGRAEGERLKTFRKIARERARDLGVAEELLARKRLLEPLFLEEVGELPEALRGWRREVLGDELDTLLAPGEVR